MRTLSAYKEIGLFEFDSPLEFRPMVAALLKNNGDIFAAKDSDLTFTDM